MNTVWVWLLSLLPLLSLATKQPLLAMYGPVLREQAQARRELVAHPGTPLSVAAVGGHFGALVGTSFLLGLLVVACAAVAAYLDCRSLRRAGVVHPFPWGWGFLGWVYIVGRAVVVRRRTGRGLAPLWVAIGLFVLASTIQIVELSSAFAAAAVS